VTVWTKINSPPPALILNKTPPYLHDEYVYITGCRAALQLIDLSCSCSHSFFPSHISETWGAEVTAETSKKNNNFAPLKKRQNLKIWSLESTPSLWLYANHSWVKSCYLRVITISDVMAVSGDPPKHTIWWAVTVLYWYKHKNGFKNWKRWRIGIDSQDIYPRPPNLVFLSLVRCFTNILHFSSW